MGVEGEQVRRFSDLAFPTRALESAVIPCQSAKRWAILHRRVTCTTGGNEANAELPITRFYPGDSSVDGADLLDFLLQVVLPFTVVLLGLLIFWALPVYLGVRWAREKRVLTAVDVVRTPSVCRLDCRSHSSVLASPRALRRMPEFHTHRLRCLPLLPLRCPGLRPRGNDKRQLMTVRFSSPVYRRVERPIFDSAGLFC